MRTEYIQRCVVYILCKIPLDEVYAGLIVSKSGSEYGRHVLKTYPGQQNVPGDVGALLTGIK
jgi:hypothetical protein